ncbi:A/G-specific adenine glycosylase [Actibacterium ureilyticum]|uniref:A/G-specific adenine glycosylase n=1 Tax=Actibacterium ureilyticum TaxID=1590614 RepID=UPI000BAB0427|nr:A/G-specific adenine glycosylase [Actibacterium ureilyticum]
MTPSDLLLTWYDAHARDLPWRVGPADRRAGVAPDPYRVWLSEIMLQQTTVAAVMDYFTKFTTLWPSVDALAAAHDPDVMAAWAGLGYYARARNLLKCARVVAQDHGGVFPTDHDALLALPGIGPYTAAAISAIAFDRPATVVDGNVERVMARFHAEETPLPRAKPILTELAAALTPAERPGDYAQAVMDLGATICTPRNPACGICPLITDCAARAQGIAADLPRKEPKAPKPIRFGAIYLAQRGDGAWLLERRPEKGLLGGMLGWPGTDWRTDAPPAQPPLGANWTPLPEEVRHTFTHFHLRLSVHVAQVADTPAPDGLFWAPLRQFRAADLPTVMRKAYQLVQSSQALPDP